MSDGPPVLFSVTARGTLAITAYRPDSDVPVQVEIDGDTALGLRDAIDEALAAQARGGGGTYGPVPMRDGELYVAATPGGVRITVAR